MLPLLPQKEVQFVLRRINVATHSSLENNFHSLIHELTFVANIQVYFADFPYLHYSITPEALNLGDLLRFLVRIVLKKAVDRNQPQELSHSP